MQTELTTAQVAPDSMMANVDELNIEPGLEHANRSLVRKTIVAGGVRRTAAKALEATSGSSYFRPWGRKGSCVTLKPRSFTPCQQRSSIISPVASPWAWIPWRNRRETGHDAAA